MSSYHVLLPMISFEEIQTKWFLFLELQFNYSENATVILQFWHLHSRVLEAGFGLKGRRYASGLTIECFKKLLAFKVWNSDQLQVTSNLKVVTSRKAY